MPVPQTRLIVVAAVLLIATAAYDVYAGVWLAAPITAVALAIVAIGDLAVRAGRPCPWTASCPEIVRVSRGRDGDIPVLLSPRTKVTPPSQLRFAIALPIALDSEREYIELRTPAKEPDCWAYWPFRARRRGIFPIEAVHLEVASPLGLWAHRYKLAIEGEVRVYPNLDGVRKSLSAIFLNRGMAGLHAQRQLGKGREFEQLREYQAGDSFEDIHWKATARRGEPITKVYQIERTQEVYVVVDTSRLTARTDGRTGDDAPQLDEFLNAALALGLVAQRQGDLFGVVAFDTRVRAFVRARSGRAHFNACREALHALQPASEHPDYAELFTFLRMRIPKRALLVVLTALDDPLLSESFARHVDLIARKHLVLVNAFQAPNARPAFTGQPAASDDDVYRALAGHLEYADLLRTRQTLQQKNVALSLIQRGSLATDLVTQYMQQKMRQAI